MKLPALLEFQWDKGNAGKILLKHGLGVKEIEESFFDSKKKIFDDYKHSAAENRFILLSKNRTNTIYSFYCQTKQNSRYIREIYAQRGGDVL